MRPILEELEEEAKTESYQDGGLLGLPETEMELDVIVTAVFNLNEMIVQQS